MFIDGLFAAVAIKLTKVTILRLIPKFVLLSTFPLIPILLLVFVFFRYPRILSLSTHCQRNLHLLCNTFTLLMIEFDDFFVESYTEIFE